MSEIINFVQTETIPEAFEEYGREKITSSFGASLEEFLANNVLNEAILFSGRFLPQNPPATDLSQASLIYEVPQDPDKRITVIRYADLGNNFERIVSHHQTTPRSSKQIYKDKDIYVGVESRFTLFEGKGDIELTKFILKGQGDYLSVIERYTARSGTDQSMLIDHWVAKRISLGGPKLSDSGPSSVALTKELVAV